MRDNDIEIIDLDNDVVTDRINPSNSINNKIVGDNMPNKKMKKRHLKKGIVQTIFCFASLIFIIGCICFYGSRLIKYYKIYNPKSSNGESIQLISSAIIQNTPVIFEGSGLYRENGVYVYKGNNVNNYIRYANMNWRIIRTNIDGSLEIILDDVINALAWDFEGNKYIESDIHKYLNDVFVKNLDTSYLSKTTICTDQMETINKFSCENKNLDNYVKLLPANDFLNSVADKTTYVASSNQLLWLGTSSKEKVWHTNGSSISGSSGENTYLIKPVVTIKNSTPLISGDGTKDNPYIIEKENKNIGFASYLKIGDDTWVVYEKNNNVLKLAYASLYDNGLSTYRFSTSENEFDKDSNNSLAKLLNSNFYESLSYKDMLLDIETYTGDYTKSYKDTYKDKTVTKVGLLNVSDIKIDSSVSGYYLSTKNSDNKVFYYREDLVSSKVGLARPYRPTISIKIPKISKGSGTMDDPYVVEVNNG